MASKTDLANWCFKKLGEAKTSDISSDATGPEIAFNAIYTAVLEDMLNHGPEKGWRFSRRRFHGKNRDSITIASIANSSTSGDITITGAHTLVVGDMAVLSGDTGYDGTYDVKAISTTVDFDVTVDFAATGTGTAKWTSEEFAYRFLRPSSTRVTEVSVGGVELTDWVREGKWILTNGEATDVDMKYIAAAADLTEANFPAHFVNVLRLKLASELAYDFVQNSALSDRLLNELETIVLPRAIGMDNREVYVKESSSSWAAAGHTTTAIE